MQKLVALSITDPSLLGEVCQAYGDLIDVTAGDWQCAWGMGYRTQGLLLVRKAPSKQSAGPNGPLAGILAAQVVLVSEAVEPHAFRPERLQPMQYHDWLCVMTGGGALDSGFVARVEAHLHGFVVRASTSGSVPEAAMMVLMNALHHAHLLDARSMSTSLVQHALTAGVGQLMDLAGGRGALDAAVLLHAGDHFFALSLGRPLYVTRMTGLPGPTGRRLEPHLRVVIVTDFEPDLAHDVVAEWSGVEITSDCELTPLPIG